MEAKTQKSEKTAEPKKRAPQLEDSGEILVRMFGQDIPGSKSLYVGLTHIKGISWAVANALCIQLGLNKRMKVGELSKDDISKMEAQFRAVELPLFLRNRRRDPETGRDRHLFTNDLDMQKEFDIKRLKKIKSYRGLRHAQGLPVRGQRTRSHFRKKGGLVGIKKKNNDTKA